MCVCMMVEKKDVGNKLKDKHLLVLCVGVLVFPLDDCLL